MSQAIVTKRYARIVGLIYFLFFLTSVLSDRFLKRLIVQNDALATATHVLKHESLFRLGVATGLVATGFYVALTALFYDLFKPVDRRLSLVAAFFGMVGCAIQAVGSAFQLFSLVVLGGGQTALFMSEQLPGLSLLFLKLNDQAWNVALVFFGVYCLLLGCLILWSTFLPRLLGALMALAGLGWLTFMYPPLADHLFSYIAVVGIIAEVSLMLWLLVMGVKAERWREQAER
jgi:hypothetical protein